MTLTEQVTRSTGATAVAATLGLAAAAWILTARQTDGMDMGAATDLGSFAFFVAAWVPMMAAMMLPGAAPAVARRVRSDRHAHAVPLFVGSYLALWAVAGLAVYALYRAHGSTVAGALIIAAGVYELTPLKRDCRRRCRASVRSGFEFGLYCVGSSIGLTVVLLALGAMSVTWMAAVGVVALAQKLLPPTPVIDVPLAAAIVALGMVAAIAPSSIPGLTPRCSERRKEK
jgi:predicted metal-binding membrane protein